MLLADLFKLYPRGLIENHRWDTSELAIRDDLTPEAVMMLKDLQWNGEGILQNSDLPSDFRLAVIRDLGMPRLLGSDVEGIHLDLPILKHILNLTDEYSRISYDEFREMDEWPGSSIDSTNELGLQYENESICGLDLSLWLEAMDMYDGRLHVAFLNEILYKNRLTAESIKYLRNSIYNEFIDWERIHCRYELIEVALEDPELLSLSRDGIIRFVHVNKVRADILDKLFPDNDHLKSKRTLNLIRHYEDPLDRLKFAISEFNTPVRSSLLYHSRSVEFTRYLLSLLHSSSIRIHSRDVANMYMDDELAMELLNDPRLIQQHKSILKNPHISTTLITNYLNDEFTHLGTEEIKVNVITKLLHVKDINPSSIAGDALSCLNSNDLVMRLTHQIYSDPSFNRVYVIRRGDHRKPKIIVNDIESLVKFTQIKLELKVSLEYDGNITQEVLDILSSKIENVSVEWSRLSRDAHIDLIVDNPNLPWSVREFNTRPYHKKMVNMKNSRSMI
jgi:hypothetical protein